MPRQFGLLSLPCYPYLAIAILTLPSGPCPRPGRGMPHLVRVLNPKKAGNLTLSHETAVTIVASNGRGHVASNGRGQLSHQMTEDMSGWDGKIWQWAWLPPLKRPASRRSAISDIVQKKYTCHITLPKWHQTQSCQWTSFDKLSNHHCLPQSYSIQSTTKCKVPSTKAYQESTYIPRSRQPLINSSQTNQHTAHHKDQTTPQTIVHMGGEL